ncbi:MAG: Holliday junction branch migration DNA helicase RuvB [Candidatus Dojkabacteria bacterium]|nr:MAG: Holliday junction branch migration DNA helicase RuvB [Candidatus Dojkabacteria bacterium]
MISRYSEARKTKSSENKSKPVDKGSSLSSPSPLDDRIRPKKFDDIIGRAQEKQTLRMMIAAATKRKKAVDHILFYGPPGLGKTTFSIAMANEIGSSIRITSGPAIERQGDLAAILTGLKANDVLFIDEIHRLSRIVEESLYPAMEDGVIDIVMGKGPSAKTIRLNLEPFTLVGATTQIGKLSSPMRDRFGLVQRLDYFGTEDLVEIIRRAANLEDIEIEEAALVEIANRSRGTGRVALRLFRRVVDYYEYMVKQGETLTVDVVKEALDLLGVDKMGLEEIDRRILEIIYSHFNGGPVGLSTLAIAISEDPVTLSEVYEPFLMKQGLIKRAARGRVLTESGTLFVQQNLSSNG